MKYLITVVGPTAIGKTALSIKLAQHYNCAIISCDSRQFYREMAIGTAVPSNEELAAAPHHFIQNKSIFETYTVGDFEKEAIAKIAELHQANDYVIMVGGSGLYVDAVLNGFDDFPAIDVGVRTEINAQYQENGISWLRQELQERDPDYYQTVDQGNPQRMIRALEVCIGSGQPYSSFLNKHSTRRNFIPIIIGVTADRELMYTRINERVEMMLQDGLLEEARALYPNRSLNALQTVGYRELFDFFDGNQSLEFAISEIKKNTRRFAKRQMTWFKRNDAVAWFDFKTDLLTITDYINKKTDATS